MRVYVFERVSEREGERGREREREGEREWRGWGRHIAEVCLGHDLYVEGQFVKDIKGKLADPAFLPMFITFKAAELRRQIGEGEGGVKPGQRIDYPRSMSMASSRRGQGF